LSKQRFHYCPKCGGKVQYVQQLSGLRLTCQTCSFIFYENPVVGVAGIVLDEKGRILLGRRSGGTYPGLWCIPCGYVEYAEDVYDGIRREFKEETNLDIEIVRVFTVQSNFHDPEKHSVGIWFLSQVVDGYLQPGDDLDQVAFFCLDQIPPLAFPTDRTVVDLIAGQLAQGKIEILPLPEGM
jgi:8-oxo-dGTP diphosphatase